MTNRSDDEPAAVANSPACFMHEADDAYMGYAGKDELIAFLNELLEGERAEAWVTLEIARVAGDGPIAELIRFIQRDEERWCAVLLRHLKVLGEAPAAKVGTSCGQAMAIADLGERLISLNRGRACVVIKLREMLPRVRDDQLHTDLKDMLRSHEVNITLANDQAGGVSMNASDPRLPRLS